MAFRGGKASRLARTTPSKTLLYQFAGSAVVLPFVSLAPGEKGIVDPTPLVLGALAFQTVLLGEPISAALVLALMLVGAGIYLVNRRPTAARAAAAPSSSRWGEGSLKAARSTRSCSRPDPR